MWTETDLRQCLKHGRIEWRKHALERMLERGIGRDEAIATLASGTIIATYPDDQPTPSALVNKGGNPPLHVVAALDAEAATCFVITVYRPSHEFYELDMKTRKRK